MDGSVLFIKKSWCNVMFGENWITFDPSPHVKSPLEIQIYDYKRLKNIGILMKFSMDAYFVNLNYITELCYGRSLIALRS